jgi:hypothetical protein
MCADMLQQKAIKSKLPSVDVDTMSYWDLLPYKSPIKEVPTDIFAKVSEKDQVNRCFVHIIDNFNGEHLFVMQQPG